MGERARTSMSRSVLLERRLELSEALLRHTVPNTIIAVHEDFHLLLRLGVNDLGADGNDLLDELAGLLGCSGLLE